jgi:hypothetical protein
LLHEPLCAYCLQRGLVVPAEIADHVERHGGDWTRFLTGHVATGFTFDGLPAGLED